jgi:hypothetical protein
MIAVPALVVADAGSALLPASTAVQLGEVGEFL